MSYKPNFDIKALLEAGVHFGHRKNHWNPEMAKYIYGVKNKAHIIDLKQSAHHLYNALRVMFTVASNKGKVLFVNTKKQSTDVVKNAADKCSQYYVNHRWLGGMLTNWTTVSSSIKTLKKYEEILDSEEGLYTKKELLDFTRKKEKLEKAIGGIRNLVRLPDILFVIDVKTHAIAIQEANKLNIPVIAIVDTNSSPKGVDFVIPGNDDSRKSIKLYCNLMSEAILAGMEINLTSEGVNVKNISDKNKEKTETINKN
ncbi:30S ribosomal protein S2 [Rickettsiales endosymbiont of Trichoplax sp. H2]|uniref:30S ribosomal protein S2 n=1 Tax=Rickettsiales endosymbiont of Trichoplax sp. H2 TaxID=2021221 RepID=UPI0012B34C32|nr:30S ribosomal protein S2 [Rickettsiales endosymbiont of Trichoplax sp. H2]MSO13887.1 30S ribosomal protein S2 [Rickettsiales endosymbiont of Trichoplax sp. H2]